MSQSISYIGMLALCASVVTLDIMRSGCQFRRFIIWQLPPMFLAMTLSMHGFVQIIDIHQLILPTLPEVIVIVSFVASVYVVSATTAVIFALGRRMEEEHEGLG